MSRITYIDRRFNASSQVVIDQANEICAAYQRDGYDLTLRQLYYQFVARGLLANNDRNYKRLGSIVNDARMAGEMDWNYIVDRTRELRGLGHFDTPADVIDAAQRSYHNDLWANQPERVEVWIEKDALVGVVAGASGRNDVNYFSCRGYTSQSEMHAAARRHLLYERRGQDVTVIHLGDHDPSGIDMTRDIQDRLNVFGANTRIERIALTMDQVEAFNPPPNPAKLTDSRATDYIAEYGSSSWELDALDPATLDGLVEAEILRHRDDVIWEADYAAQEQDREALVRASENWPEVAEFVETLD